MLFTFPFLTRRQYITLGKKAFKTEGSTGSTFMRYIEGSVIGMLYRMQVYSNMFDIYKFIVFGNVFVEKRLITYPKLILSIGEILSFEKYSKELLRLNKLNRVILKRQRFNRPRYMYISHKFMFGIIYRNIRRVDLAYRYRNIDIYRGADISK